MPVTGGPPRRHLPFSGGEAPWPFLPLHQFPAMSNAGFRFLVCPDSRLLQAHMEAMLHDAGADSTWERHVYWGDDVPPPRFWEQLTLQGLFGTPRTLVVRQAHLWPVAIWKKLSGALAHLSDQCHPFFCLEVPWEKGQPKLPAALLRQRCLSFAEAQGWVWRHEGLGERSLRKYVTERARQLGLLLEPDAQEQFCLSVPPQAQAVENELQKLVLQVPPGQAVTVAAPVAVDAAMLGASSWSPDCNVFALIRHLEAGNLPAAWRELERGRKDGDGLLFTLLSLLAREFRLLWQVGMGERVRLHPAEAGSKQQLARRLGQEGLSRGLALVMDAEWQVKSGRRTPEQCLDFLATQLYRLCAAPARR